MKAETKTVRCLKKTPSYKLTAHDGSIVAQHHYTGHTHAIVYFLQSANNPRCRAYCQELNERVTTAKTYKTVIVAIAPEPVEELARAHRELGLGFPLLSDAQSEVAGRYGLVEKGWFGPARQRAGLVVHDKYGIAYLVAVADADERPSWPEIEDTLKRFPRG